MCVSNTIGSTTRVVLWEFEAGVWGFHGKCVLGPADSAASSVFVVCRLHCIGTLGWWLEGAGACRATGGDGVSVVNAHLNELPVEFFVCVNEGQDRLQKIIIGLDSFSNQRLIYLAPF